METKPTKEQFHAYQDVQFSGLTNMYDIARVQELSSKYYKVELPDSIIFYIMKNYTKLKEEYGTLH